MWDVEVVSINQLQRRRERDRLQPTAEEGCTRVMQTLSSGYTPPAHSHLCRPCSFPACAASVSLKRTRMDWSPSCPSMIPRAWCTSSPRSS